MQGAVEHVGRASLETPLPSCHPCGNPCYPSPSVLFCFSLRPSSCHLLFSIQLLLPRILLKGIPSASWTLLQLLGKIPTPESPPSHLHLRLLAAWRDSCSQSGCLCSGLVTPLGLHTGPQHCQVRLWIPLFCPDISPRSAQRTSLLSCLCTWPSFCSIHPCTLPPLN